MSEDRFHDWDAAYVLGMLGPDERREFERHLTTCAACATAVAELAGIPGILGAIPRDEAVALSEEADAQAKPRDPDLVTRLATAAGRRQRRNRWVIAGVGAAAASLLAVGGVAIGSSIDGPDQPALVAMVQVRPGIMTADISVEEKAWGTRFDWSCDYLNTAIWNGGNPTYDLVATANDGTETIVASWSATGPKATSLAASSSLPTSSIRKVEIRLAGSNNSLTMLDL